MALENVRPQLSKEFVLLKLDYDRATGARDIAKRYNGEQGLPWFAFLDGDGRAVVTSTGPKGNVGHPYQPEEVAWFKQMLQQVKHHLTDADIAALITSLEQANKASGGG